MMKSLFPPLHSLSLTLSALLLSTLALIPMACKSDSLLSSRSYKGHKSDRDQNNFVNAFPATLGTRLDDCQTCHKGGTFTYDSGGTIKTVFKNNCDFCHLKEHPDATFIEPQPTSFDETLNAYGLAYKQAGRSVQALIAIGAKDSDGDGHSNNDEIDDMKYPGDDTSKPGQSAVPIKTYTMAQLKALAAHSQFQLANSHKQQYDFYATYKGVTIKDLLTAAGVNTADAAFQGITVIAPDGYLKDFTADEVNNAYPKGLYYAGLDTATLGTECGFVLYPNTLPSGLTDGAEVADIPWLLLAYERDGLAMAPSELDITSGKINGEGPFRIVVPQSNPGKPDRGSKYSPTTCNDGNDYVGSKDHNAGAMVRGVIAIRLNPMPAGFEEFDYKNGGWAYVDSKSVILYGFGITGN